MNFERPKDTPILQLMRKRMEMVRDLQQSTDTTDEENEKKDEKLRALEDELMAMPTTCVADFAAKLIVDTCEAGLFSDWKLGSLWREARDLVGMPLMGMHDEDYSQAQSRLKSFAAWTGTVAPQSMLDDDGAPTDELLDYCRHENLSLDWLFLGDEKSLVLGLRKKAA